MREKTPIDERRARLRQLLREYREARGMSQRELAEASGLTWMTCYRIETNRRRKLNRDELEAISLALRVDPAALMREAGYTAVVWEDER